MKKLIRLNNLPKSCQWLCGRIILNDYPQKYPLVWGQRRAFYGQKACQCVPQCILGGVAVLFTVRKHACAPKATPRLNFYPCNSLWIKGKWHVRQKTSVDFKGFRTPQIPHLLNVITIVICYILASYGISELSRAVSQEGVSGCSSRGAFADNRLFYFCAVCFRGGVCRTVCRCFCRLRENRKYGNDFYFL